MSPSEIIIPNWSAPSHVFACTTTRQGGISSKPYDTFNLAAHVGDDIGNVVRNRQLLLDKVELPAQPWWLEQVHSTTVIKVGSDKGEAMEADASWTDQPGVVCAVLTADCLPVVFTDKKGTMVAVAHAGWRGLAHGILEATIEKLPTDPINLIAWMGPAIGRAHFEVGGEVRDIFTHNNNAAQEAFTPSEELGKWLADIYLLASMRMAACGVNQIFGGGLCTYADPHRFYSYRRSKETGRMATLIYIK